MKRYVLRRLLSFIPVLLGVVTIAFFLMRLLPGDPAAVMLSKSGASAEQVQQLRATLGLDQPIYLQYWAFLRGIVRGDFGASLWEHRPVMSMIAEQMPSTIQLALAALLVALLVGTPLGIFAAIYRNSWIDRLSVMLAVLGVSMPMFWSGLLLILLFSATLNWLPAYRPGRSQTSDLTCSDAWVRLCGHRDPHCPLRAWSRYCNRNTSRPPAPKG